MKPSNFLPYLKDKSLIAAILVLALAASLFSQAVWPLIAQATSPQFNIYTPYTHTQSYGHDYFLLDVKNETKGTDWGFPVSADAGDVLVFYLYYHNGVNETIANNTTLRVSLPSGQSTQHTVTGYLWADNASNATRSNPLSQAVQINLSSVQNLEYISGSAKWYPNQADWRYDSPTPFPGGQTGGMLFDTGINIGQAEGCWEFSGAIVFKMKVSCVQYEAKLAIDKKIKNLTENETQWNDTVNAKPRQRLAVQIQISNPGNATANNVIGRDELPDKLLYLTGSTKIDDLAAPDGITSAGGLNIGALNPGQTKTIYFEVGVEREVKFVRGTTVLINTGLARADNIGEIQDSAKITVYYSGCSPEKNIPPAR